MMDLKAQEEARRNSAVSIELSKGGSIRELISRPSGLFVITETHIMRVNSPNDLDPHINHTSVPWAQSEFLPYGMTNRLVARTVLQTKSILEHHIFLPNIKSEILELSWRVLESLSSLEFIKNRFSNGISEIQHDITEDGISLYTTGNTPKALPVLEGYDIEFRSFSLEVKHALQVISEIFNVIFNANIGTARFDNAIKWAAKSKLFGEDHRLTKMLEEDQKWIKIWIDIRNAIEHPKKNRFLETCNFILEPNRKIRLPTWRLEHSEHKTLSEPQNLLYSLSACIEMLLKLYEDIQIILLSEKNQNGAVEFKAIPEENRDKARPFRFKIVGCTY